MSLINNIPFDINRTPVERNATVKRGGTVPVQHSEALHPTEKHNRINERRSGSRRHRQPKNVNVDKRLLGERRQDISTKIADEFSEKPLNSGSVIDLEV